jgi:hypothetical protein
MQGGIWVLLVKTYKLSYTFSSKRQDPFASDATFKKYGPTTTGRPREKRFIGSTEKARMIKASSNRQKTHQACSF